MMIYHPSDVCWTEKPKSQSAKYLLYLAREGGIPHRIYSYGNAKIHTKENIYSPAYPKFMNE
jgi:hypothetical protein